MRWAVQAEALPECSLLLLENITVTVRINTKTVVTNSPHAFYSPVSHLQSTERPKGRAGNVPQPFLSSLQPLLRAAHFISALALHTLFLITHIFSGCLRWKEQWWECARLPGPFLWCDVISLSISHSFLRTPQVSPKDLWTLLSIDGRKRKTKF